jgi:hypothetical protein
LQLPRGILVHVPECDLVFPEGGRGLECGEEGEKLERGLEAGSRMVSDGSGARPLKRVVGAVCTKLSLESTWQTMRCLIECSKYVFGFVSNISIASSFAILSAV